MQHSPELFDALGDAQGIGFLGARPIPEVVAHADAFVLALDGVAGRLVDLGSGGGVPGLVIADARPDLSLVLVDRREKRTDFLRRVVLRLGWSDRIDVVTGDAAVLGRQSAWADQFDAVVSRGFGPPDLTIRLSRPFARPGGLIVLTEPPAEHGDRWSDDPPTGLVRRSPIGHPVVVWERS